MAQRHNRVRIGGLATVACLGLLWLAGRPALAGTPSTALTVGSTTVTFPNTSPAVSSSVTATEGAITINVHIGGLTPGNWTLTAIANGDLISGTNTIPISNVSWTGVNTSSSAYTGAGYIDGTLSKTAQQTVSSGSWTQPGAVDLNGTITFHLANLWTYNIGTYSQTITLTATAF